MAAAVQILDSPSQSKLANATIRKSPSVTQLAELGVESFNQIDQMRFQQKVVDRLIRNLPQPQAFHMADILDLLRSGAQVIVEDDFSNCFVQSADEPWNWNSYLYPLWILGFICRYLILFPIRMFLLAGGFLCFALAFTFTKFCVSNSDTRNRWEKSLISFLCGVFVFSWTGVVKYHGIIPANKPGRIFVANHSSMIDMMVLGQQTAFATVGQQHTGWVGALQTHVLSSIGGVFFQRNESNDRRRTAAKIKAYCNDPKSNRLLIFPEGTCVNTEHVVQFKRGVFDMDCAICPIAIKYNKIFVDAYWNSRARSFQGHLFDLMTSWALVCDVFYLDPMYRLDDETSEQFAWRVQQKIADAGGFKNTNWNGYLKYFKPSARFVEEKRKRFAKSLQMKLAAASRSQHESDEDDDTVILSPQNTLRRMQTT